MKVLQEPDALNERSLWYGLIAFVAMILVALAITWWLMGSHVARAGERSISRSAYSRMNEVNQLETSVFRGEPAARPSRHAAERELGSYGWVDQQRGIVHLPIDRAIDLYLSGARASAADGAAPEATP